MPRGVSTSYKSKASNAKDYYNSITQSLSDELTRARQGLHLYNESYTAAVDLQRTLLAADVLFEENSWLDEFLLNSDGVTLSDLRSRGAASEVIKAASRGVQRLIDIISAYESLVTRMTQETDAYPTMFSGSFDVASPPEQVAPPAPSAASVDPDPAMSARLPPLDTDEPMPAPLPAESALARFRAKYAASQAGFTTLTSASSEGGSP